MSYPQQPMPDHSNPTGEPVSPSAGAFGQSPPPPIPAPLSPPLPGGRPLPPSRPAGVVVGGVGMFVIGFSYLVVIALGLFQLVERWGLLSREPAFLITELVVLLTQLITLVVAVTAGALVLMNKPVGRMLSFGVVGAVLLIACHSVTRDSGLLISYGIDHGRWIIQILFILLSVVLLVVSVVVGVMLAPQRVEEWLRNRPHPAVAGLPAPIQQPVGQIPGQQQPPGVPPVPGQPYSGPPTPTDYQPPQPPA
ncbi:hypothetical protein FB566_2941 [Stackebrandtia endophytica]|uniref:Uncharacterized protein n=1 Tax=Stackebrandtia endophytica TaxID=1496996 RepID=A0A543AXS7_9ACTN|nr:hypothetical protein [Stackebrandtia endophytica]TQL77382.1 hypothetical protein FB566_2941 [Stackebrandtia endophytica]